MTINEAAKHLNIDKHTIKHYEKEGLLPIGFADNKFRDCGESDIKRLKDIIILEEMGIPPHNIKKLFHGDITFREAVRLAEDEYVENRYNFYIAPFLRQVALEDQSDLPDTERYWSILKSREKLLYSDPKTVFQFYVKQAFGSYAKNIKAHPKYGIAIILFICLASGLIQRFVFNRSFVDIIINILYPVLLLALVLAVFMPIAFIGKKYPKAAIFLNTVLLILCLAVLGAVLIIFIYALIKYITELM